MKRFEMTQLFALLGINGADLLLRSYGQHAFPTLEHAMKEVPPVKALLLDFAGVSVMDTSFADETVLELALGLSQDKYGDRRMILEEPSPATIDHLDATIQRRKAKVPVLIRQDDHMP